jgi:hypothetical protein
MLLPSSPDSPPASRRRSARWTSCVDVTTAPARPAAHPRGPRRARALRPRAQAAPRDPAPQRHRHVVRPDEPHRPARQREPDRADAIEQRRRASAVLEDGRLGHLRADLRGLRSRSQRSRYRSLRRPRARSRQRAKQRHQGDDYDFADDAIYLVNLTTGVPVPLDLGNGNYEYTLKRARQILGQRHARTERNLLFDTIDETQARRDHGVDVPPRARHRLRRHARRPNLDDPYACPGPDPVCDDQRTRATATRLHRHPPRCATAASPITCSPTTSARRTRSCFGPCCRSTR